MQKRIALMMGFSTSVMFHPRRSQEVWALRIRCFHLRSTIKALWLLQIKVPHREVQAIIKNLLLPTMRALWIIYWCPHLVPWTRRSLRNFRRSHLINKIMPKCKPIINKRGPIISINSNSNKRWLHGKFIMVAQAPLLYLLFVREWLEEVTITLI